MQPKVPQEIKGLLRSGESVVWYGRPVKAAYIRKYLPFAGIGLIMVLGSIFMFIPMMTINSMDMPGGDEGGSFYESFIGFFIAFIVVGLVVALAPIVVASMLANNLQYAITDQRLITVGGIFGPGIQSTDFDKVQSVDVIVGFFDRAYGTGTIMAVLPGVVYSGQGHYRTAGHSLQAVGSPYMVQKDMMGAMDNYNRTKSGVPATLSKAKKSKFCRYCDAKLPVDSRFCSACGKEQ